MDNKNIIPALERIRAGLEVQIPSFPTQCCGVSALRVKKNLDFNIELGKIIRNGKGIGHFWNTFEQTGQEYYVDISADKYGLPRIFISTKDDAIHLYGYLPDPDSPEKKATIELIRDEKRVFLS